MSECEKIIPQDTMTEEAIKYWTHFLKIPYSPDSQAAEILINTLINDSMPVETKITGVTNFLESNGFLAQTVGGGTPQYMLKAGDKYIVTENMSTNSIDTYANGFLDSRNIFIIYRNSVTDKLHPDSSKKTSDQDKIDFLNKLIPLLQNVVTDTNCRVIFEGERNEVTSETSHGINMLKGEQKTYTV